MNKNTSQNTEKYYMTFLKFKRSNIQRSNHPMNPKSFQLTTQLPEAHTTINCKIILLDMNKNTTLNYEKMLHDVLIKLTGVIFKEVIFKKI